MTTDLLTTPLPALDDEEGPHLPDGLPPVTDAHVHLFPDPMWEAIRGWFDRHGWPVRYRMPNAELVDYLLDRGVDHIVALHYAHRSGMARSLNAQLAEFCAERPQVTGMATVMPGEDGARAILEEGFALGLAGVKLHLHVQGVDPASDEMQVVYRTCADHDKPLVMHAGKEPRSPAYPVDPHEICSADRIERVLTDYPALRLCIPHLGADEYDAYESMLGRFGNLWLDTTMMLAGYFDLPEPWHFLRQFPERILFGTDYPNIPYAWDREVRRIAQAGLTAEQLEAILGGTARALYGT